MIHPTIHMNGSGEENLRRDYCDASDALQTAFDVLKRTGPNGRDYYTQGPEALYHAITEHDARLRRIDEVKGEIDRLAIGLDDHPEGGEVTL